MKNKEIEKVEPKELTKEMILATSPKQAIKQAQEASSALMDVIKNSRVKITTKIGAGEHLHYEAWQTLAKFYGYTVGTTEPEPIEVFGVKGMKAKAILYDPIGNIVGGAEAYCLSDEKTWAGKPWFQLGSMAQTRAAAKALRNVLSWIVVLAGYKPTPAEEMTGEEVPIETDSLKQSQNFGKEVETEKAELRCSVCNTPLKEPQLAFYYHHPEDEPKCQEHVYANGGKK
jgi:hypothetical protein